MQIRCSTMALKTKQPCIIKKGKVGRVMLNMVQNQDEGLYI